jgi:hypothetical protein
MAEVWPFPIQPEHSTSRDQNEEEDEEQNEGEEERESILKNKKICNNS